MSIKTRNTKLIRVGCINIKEEEYITVVSGNFSVTTKVVSWFGGFVIRGSKTKARLIGQEES